jgi:hypothetical protein
MAAPSGFSLLTKGIEPAPGTFKDTSESILNKKKDYTDSRTIIREKRVSSHQGNLHHKKLVGQSRLVDKDNYPEPDVNSDESECVSPRYSFSTEIPERYNETYIAAIPKDPDSLFVYWEFSDETVQLMHTMMDPIGSKVVLRVKETECSDGNGDILSFHVEGNKQQEEFLLKIPEHGKTYHVECGHFTPKGEFVQIAQSDPVVIPFAHSEMQMSGSAIDTLECSPKAEIDSTHDNLRQTSLHVNQPVSICNSQVCNSLSYSSTFGSAAHF